MNSIPRSLVQIMLACAIGAFACSAIAIATGYNIWFGIAAGLIAGYLAYDFREVLKAIPEAFTKVRDDLQPLRDRLRYADPIVGPAYFLAIVLPFSILFRPISKMWGWAINGNPDELISFLLLVFMLEMMSFFLGAFFATTLRFIATYGSERWEKVCFRYSHPAASGELRSLWGPAVPMVDPTYPRVFRWTCKGLLSIASGLLWRMWPSVFKGLVGITISFFKGCWKLFVLIHRYERVLCAIDGTVGGVAGYTLLARPEHSLLQNTVAVLFGMLIGAGWGAVNYEIVSKRILKVVPVETT